MSGRKPVKILWVLVGLLLGVVLLAAGTGAVSIPLIQILSGDLTSAQQAILFHIRLPRIALAVIVGVSLAVSGAAMQGLFRNPLADPGLIGISSGAALAVAVVIVLAGGTLSGFLGLYSLGLAAFVGGLLTCLVIFRFARLSGHFSVTYMLLAGIAITALTGSGIGFLTYISTDQQLRALSFWTMGSVSGALWPAVGVAATVIFPASLVLMHNAQKLNILLLGEEEATHLGVETDKLKRLIIVCTALSVGVAVAVSGLIGFVGLVVPHLIRLSIGPDHRLLLPASALLGAALLLIADSLARTIVTPAEMPVGILTSLIGGPFFLWLLVKQYSGRFGL